MDTTETPLQTAIKIAKSMLLALAMMAGIVLVFGAYLSITRIPDADVHLIRVDRDTTFYVGTSESTGSGSERIAILATGSLTGSSASIRVEHTKPVAVAHELELGKGPIHLVYSGDYYATRAKITYVHGRVKQGHLRLQIKLSSPPKEWINN